MSRLRRILTVMRLETLHLRRDRLTRALLLMVPALQLVLFGYAVNLDPRHVPVAIAGASEAAAEAARRLVEQAQLTVIASELPPGGAERHVASGSALIGIELAPPPDLADPEAEPPRTRIVVDASDAAAVRPALAALERALLRQAATLPETAVAVEWRYNPEQRTDWSVVPGLAGAVAMISMLMLGALTLVRERERGTWEGLLSTPVTAVDALAGKLTPYLPIGVVQTLLIVLLAAALFDLPVRGMPGLLLIAAVLSAASYLAIGFAISALARTQMQAIQFAVMLYLPSMLLSGFMFPFQGMPGWAQAIGNGLPLTHFVRVSRDVLLRGASDERALVAIGWLAVIAPVTIVLAAASYRRRLD